MKESIQDYVRRRARMLGLTLSELCTRAKISRQTLYSLDTGLNNPMPSLQTIVSIAQVLQVHPMRLLYLIFDNVPLSEKAVARRSTRDQSVLIRDVTFPDGALVFPGQVFTKTWEVQNVGKVAWENRFLVCMDEEIIVHSRHGDELKLAQNLKPTHQRIPIPLTRPGEILQLSIEFTVPNLSGTVLSYWKSVFEDGTLCFPKAHGLWVKVLVTTLANAATETRTSQKTKRF